MIVVYSDDVIGKHICVIYIRDWDQLLEQENNKTDMQASKIIYITKMLKNLNYLA